MKQVLRGIILLAWCAAGCTEAADNTVTGAPSTASDAGTQPGADEQDASDVMMEPVPPTDGKVDAGTAIDAGSMGMPSGDPCMDAASRIAGCFLNRSTSGTPACKAGAADATPTVARFLIAGGSCETLIRQGINATTPCEQAPMPMHVMQLVGYAAAAKLCNEGPANTAATCNDACKNAAPCVDAKMLDEKLKDAARCFDGCIRNAEDAAAFSCSAKLSNDCNALADKCWTAP